MRAADTILWIAATLAGLLSMLVAADFVTALGSQPCGSPDAGPDCYPWGAEGPAAEFALYQSKQAYLVSGAVQIVAAVTALGAMAASREKRRSGHRVIAALAIGIFFAIGFV